MSEYIRVIGEYLKMHWYKLFFKQVQSTTIFGSITKRSESPVQSPQSWPPVHRRLFLAHWTACRLSLSWGGKRCRPLLACVLHRLSWSLHHHTSASAASHRSLRRSVSDAGGEIGSFLICGKTRTTTEMQKLVSAVRIFTPRLPVPHRLHSYYCTKKTKSSKNNSFVPICYLTEDKHLSRIT